VFEVPEDDKFLWQLTVDVNASAGEPDIYLKYNHVPTYQDVDAREWASNDLSSTVVVDPQPGTWYVAIRALHGKPASYQWKVMILPISK